MSKELFRFVLLLFILLVAYFTRHIRTSKTEFAAEYGVSRHVLAKWIEHFQDQISVDEWKATRFLSELDKLCLRALFGEGQALTMNKAQLAKAVDTNYRDLCRQVSHHATKYGLTEHAWRNCHCFPPKITEAILANA